MQRGLVTPASVGQVCPRLLGPLSLWSCQSFLPLSYSLCALADSKAFSSGSKASCQACVSFGPGPLALLPFCRIPGSPPGTCLPSITLGQCSLPSQLLRLYCHPTLSKLTQKVSQFENNRDCTVRLHQNRQTKEINKTKQAHQIPKISLEPCCPQANSCIGWHLCSFFCSPRRQI